MFKGGGEWVTVAYLLARDPTLPERNPELATWLQEDAQRTPDALFHWLYHVHSRRVIPRWAVQGLSPEGALERWVAVVEGWGRPPPQVGPAEAARLLVMPDARRAQLQAELRLAMEVGVAISRAGGWVGGWAVCVCGWAGWRGGREGGLPLCSPQRIAEQAPTLLPPRSQRGCPPPRGLPPLRPPGHAPARG